MLHLLMEYDNFQSYKEPWRVLLHMEYATKNQTICEQDYSTVIYRRKNCALHLRV